MVELRIPDLEGKVFLVTGASSGGLAAQGAAVAVHYYSNEAWAHYGRIDGLINNAGSLIDRRPIGESDAAHDRAVLELNALSVVWTSRAALPSLSRQGGVVINTSSIVARNGGDSGAVLYAAAKGFVSTYPRFRQRSAHPWHPRQCRGARCDRDAVARVLQLGRAAHGDGRGHSDGAGGDARRMRRRLSVSRLGSAQRLITGQVLEVNGGQLMP
jgi:3-oxoacyl-[acyl-carrier protein] reductase